MKRINVFLKCFFVFNLVATLPFKRQPHKIVKHTQTIRRLLPTNCLSVFDHFLGLALKGLNFIHRADYFRNFFSGSVFIELCS